MKHLYSCLVIMLLIVASSCSNSPSPIEMLRANGIQDVENVPMNFNGWQKLTGNYVYMIDVFNKTTSPQLTFLLANKKENKLVGVYNINPHVIVAAIAPKVSPETVVINYDELKDKDIKRLTDMNGFNALLKNIPELKNFEWKNDMQNRIVSGIMYLVHFNYVYKNKADTSQTNAGALASQKNHETMLKEIFNTDYTMHRRMADRLNEAVEMSQYIQKLGFKYEYERPVNLTEKNEAVYINDLMAPDSINFKGKGKMFFFYPFKSFRRPKNTHEYIFYSPAIQTFEYTHTLDEEGFPVFKLNTHFVSLLGN